MYKGDLLDYYGIKVFQKGDWQKWWHYIVPLYFFVIGIFDERRKIAFYERYTTVLGNYMYVPDLKKFWAEIEQMEGLIRHEGQHVDDIKTWLARIRYVVSKKWRLFFEVRGYFWNIYIDITQYGHMRGVTMHMIIDALSGSMYGHMTTREHATIIVRQLENAAKRRYFPNQWKDTPPKF